jgi:hypothetical protein
MMTVKAVAFPESPESWEGSRTQRVVIWCNEVVASEALRAACVECSEICCVYGIPTRRVVRLWHLLKHRA